MVWAPAACTALTRRRDRWRGIKVDAAVVQGEPLLSLGPSLLGLSGVVNAR